MEKELEIDMLEYNFDRDEEKRNNNAGRGLVSNRMKCARLFPSSASTPGRNRFAKWFYCSYRPFMRCYFPWELIDFLLFFSFFAMNALAFYLIGGFHHLHSLKE